jgi:hypothetical protein
MQKRPFLGFLGGYPPNWPENPDFGGEPPLTSAKKGQKSIFVRQSLVKFFQFFRFTGGGTGTPQNSRGLGPFFGPLHNDFYEQNALKMRLFGPGPGFWGGLGGFPGKRLKINNRPNFTYFRKNGLNFHKKTRFLGYFRLFLVKNTFFRRF